MGCGQRSFKVNLRTRGRKAESLPHASGDFRWRGPHVRHRPRRKLELLYYNVSSHPHCFPLPFEMAPSKAPLRIGFVPEHFSTPLQFAQKHFSLSAQLMPFPSGTGHMITALRAGEIDVGIGLTEGWVAGLGKEDVEGDGGYKIVGTYVETPLCTLLALTSAMFHTTLPPMLTSSTQAGQSPPAPPAPSTPSQISRMTR